MSNLAALIHDNEQDRAMMNEWWKLASLEDKLVIWETIQTEYTDPNIEIMSRFAQIAFAEKVEAELNARK